METKKKKGKVEVEVKRVVAATVAVMDHRATHPKGWVVLLEDLITQHCLLHWLWWGPTATRLKIRMMEILQLLLNLKTFTKFPYRSHDYNAGLVGVT